MCPASSSLPWIAGHTPAGLAPFLLPSGLTLSPCCEIVLDLPEEAAQSEDLSSAFSSQRRSWPFAPNNTGVVAYNANSFTPPSAFNARRDTACVWRRRESP